MTAARRAEIEAELHREGCARCRKADGPEGLCRTGRELRMEVMATEGKAARGYQIGGVKIPVVEGAPLRAGHPGPSCGCPHCVGKFGPARNPGAPLRGTVENVAHYVREMGWPPYTRENYLNDGYAIGLSSGGYAAMFSTEKRALRAAAKMARAFAQQVDVARVAMRGEDRSIIAQVSP